jgi:hypothetical protein
MKIYSRIPPYEVRYVTLERYGLPQWSPERHKFSPSTPSQYHQGQRLFPHYEDGKLHNHFTTSTKEKPEPLHNLPRRDHRSTNRQGNKEVTPPRVTSSPTQTNCNGYLNTYARMQKQEHQRCSNPSHSNRTKAKNSMEKLERKNNG